MEVLLKVSAGITPILFGFVCYFVKKMCDKVDTIGDGLNNFKLEITKEYVTKNEFHNVFTENKKHDRDIICQLLETLKEKK